LPKASTQMIPVRLEPMSQVSQDCRLNHCTTAPFIARLRRPIGRMTVQEQKLEGEYRYVISRLITNSEEVAFYQGNRKESSIIHAAFNKLVSNVTHSGFSTPKDQGLVCLGECPCD